MADRVRALVFDLDGTLVDSRGDIVASCNFALTSAGRDPLSADEISSFVGNGARSLVARAFRIPASAPEVAGHLDCFLSYYATHPADHTAALPGAQEALRLSEHYQLGLCTNKARSTTLGLLGALGWLDAFGSIVAGGDTDELKPHPAPLLRACHELSVAPGEVWMIGDGPQDIGAAKAAGAIAVAVLGGFAADESLRNAGPDHVIPSLDQLPKLLQRVTRS